MPRLFGREALPTLLGREFAEASLLFLTGNFEEAEIVKIQYQIYFEKAMGHGALVWYFGFLFVTLEPRVE